MDAQYEAVLVADFVGFSWSLSENLSDPELVFAGQQQNGVQAFAHSVVNTSIDVPCHGCGCSRQFVKRTDCKA